MQFTERLRRVVSDIFEVPAGELKPDSSPDNISTWDSLRHLNLVLALEQEFGIEFSPEEIEQLLSVDLIESFVEEKLKTGVAK